MSISSEYGIHTFDTRTGEGPSRTSSRPSFFTRVKAVFVKSTPPPAPKAEAEEWGGGEGCNLYLASLMVPDNSFCTHGEEDYGLIRL